MVIKGEYLTLDERTWKKKGYVFEDYKPCHFVYHYTNLIIGTNIQLQTMPSKNSSKVWYFLPYSKHEKLMETISIKSDLNGLLEWYSIKLSLYLYIPFTNSISVTSRPMSPFVSNIVTFSTSLYPPYGISLSIYLYMFIYPSLLHPSHSLFPTYISSTLSTFIPLSLLYHSLFWFSYFQNQVIVCLWSNAKFQS